MNKLSTFRGCQSKRDLAFVLGYSEKQLNHILFSNSTSNAYYNFTIPKKTGGQRQILAPNLKLKELQTALATLLSHCYDVLDTERLLKSGIKDHSVRSFSSHGFRRKLVVENLPREIRFGIYSNAKNHTNKRYVLNIDIENFFESITFARIVGYFMKNENFLLPYPVAILIAQISTYRPPSGAQGYLPQGSPLSPIISNLIGSILDAKILNLAKSYRLDYSRYADDITLSTNAMDFPLDIAYMSNGAWVVGSKLEKVIKTSKFDVNHKKTRLYYKSNRQEVTSLTVNKKVNVNKYYYRNTRSMVHQYCKTGAFFCSSKHRKDMHNSAHSLSSVLGFIYEIKTREDELNQEIAGIKEIGPTIRSFEKFSSIEKLYTRFLFHSTFVYPDRTVVIGEGITDQLHLRVAYKKLFDNKANFVSSMRFTYLGKLKRFTDFTKFDGGTSLLKTFIKDYHLFFKSQTLGPNPCIILVDNDVAGTGVIKEARKSFPESINYIKISVGRNVDFYHVYHNLYIAQLTDIKDIEDLYPLNVVDTVIDNMIFESVAKKDATYKGKVYSKKYFYENVIRPDKDIIDFSGFQPIFETFNYIQLHYCIHRLSVNYNKNP